MHWSEYLLPLAEGAWVTVQLTVYSTILGGVLAFVFGIGKLSSNMAIKSVSVGYIELFRGTSLLVQLFWLYFALPLAGMAIGIDLRLPPVVAGVLALGLNIGAYGAEVVRGAIQSVHQNQREAARALNFTPRQTLFNIVIPQAIPEMMPSFGNLAVQNLKDTALVSLISLGDLTFRAEQIRNFTQDSTTIYTLLLLMYFGMALVVTVVMHLIERFAGRWRMVGS
ncbi:MULTISPECIES: ectoine/hydroxyectoine ABC transporter permease subunit EhuC [Aminobacter]|jgi:polar amino acid transport system permease protein|uniref:Amino-acid ABC transporter permease protein y4tF n=2 Tax=Aminobacter TaxID=31988 RepID=A0AAC8YUW1_AMIAI|nr:MULTISPECIES: ectoine/hydroxyectoine ABC transporter permease subunit EhuC [Aminobacter]AMS44603.1 Putative amino-acid ABC transporter permease protein y4tF [Aminobacter aminovorans]MBA8906924.1 polar amino acid transport system permease protein [Aminobacter ciceronei]MBA9020818.1 polar amino acid transport system permease protein [Aminobacter ciceronei]MBB3708378.1 polar amino acid transport system permease protein [Aminobacter aminovorans]MRX32170.1 ectoine/hydroxyectoine ABC transporter 